MSDNDMGLDFPTPRGGDPNDPLNSLEPEMVEGPLGVPYLKPKAAPQLPLSDEEGPVDLPDLPSPSSR